MKLVEFSYDDGNWKLENLRLKDVNLLVGRNAVGKSRTLTMINWFSQFISGNADIKTGNSWYAKFINNKKQTFEFEFKTKNGVIEYELIKINDAVLLSRNFNTKTAISIAQMKSEISGELEEVYPPNDRLVLHARRDLRAYPYLEELFNWAEQSVGFIFSHHNSLTAPKNGFRSSHFITIESSPLSFADLDESDKESVRHELNQIGYNFSKIYYEQKPIPALYLLEKDVNVELSHFQLSQGLMRSLSILIYLQYLISKQKPATILIDDLCEGLDYERAIKLGKLIFEKCKDSNIQLIATTNDNFIMDVVDIEHWNLLTREGSTVTAMNYDTHRQLFDDFRFTGLSNFDFFSSDYLEQQKA